MKAKKKKILTALARLSLSFAVIMMVKNVKYFVGFFFRFVSDAEFSQPGNYLWIVIPHLGFYHI